MVAKMLLLSQKEQEQQSAQPWILCVSDSKFKTSLEHLISHAAT